MPLSKRILLLTSLEERISFVPLEKDGFILSFFQDLEVIGDIPLEDLPDLLILDIDIFRSDPRGYLIQRCKEMEIPVVLLVSEENQSTMDSSISVEDFILVPFRGNELRTRIRRALWHTGNWDSGQLIRNGDLVIDQERYEVSVAGRKVILTFKEYQLLCLLAANPGRVYTRETLLSRVWEYDYFGGTRTVDVHIRRLRSKVEDASNLFIETVRNVGYRFRVI